MVLFGDLDNLTAVDLAHDRSMVYCSYQLCLYLLSRVLQCYQRQRHPYHRLMPSCLPRARPLPSLSSLYVILPKIIMFFSFFKLELESLNPKQYYSHVYELQGYPRVRWNRSAIIFSCFNF